MMSSVEELKVAFREDAQRYIDYCQQPDSAWNKYESPLWKKYFKDLNFTGAQVMDVGTGPGKLIDLLISIGASPDSLYAIEPNTIFWEIFKSLFPSIPCVSDFAEKELSPRHYPSNCLDLVTANMVINHLSTKAYGKLTTSIYKLLKPGGAFAYTVPEPMRQSWKLGIPLNTHEDWVIQEPAPWGGTTEYFHRSFEYQFWHLKQLGFEVSHGVNAKRLMIIADKP